MSQTIRRQIMSLLAQGPHSAREISAFVSIPEKEVYSHLEHVDRTVRQAGRQLQVTPPSCRQCGYVFTERKRFRKPSKCPVCRSTFIEEPLYSLTEG